MPENDDLLLMIRQTPCVECGKMPCHGAYIRPIDDGGNTRFFNLMPLCVKHIHEQDRIGTIALSNKYRNVRRFIELKGWSFSGGKFIHRDLKGEN